MPYDVYEKRPGYDWQFAGYIVKPDGSSPEVKSAKEAIREARSQRDKFARTPTPRGTKFKAKKVNPSTPKHASVPRGKWVKVEAIKVKKR